MAVRVIIQTTPNIRKIVDNIERLERDTQIALRLYVGDFARIFERHWKQKVPVRTGRLQDSLRAVPVIRQAGNEIYIDLYAIFYYAPVQADRIVTDFINDALASARAELSAALQRRFAARLRG